MSQNFGRGSVMISPPASRSRSPYCRSAGHRHFSLHTTLSRVMRRSSWFEWVYSFTRRLTLLAWITSCTIAIPRSSWIIALATYRRASTVARSISDWHLCMIAVLDLQAQPHNSMAQAHIGVMRDSRSKRLLLTERRGDFSSNQYSSLCRRSICFRFLICSFQFSLFSKCNPRYFTVAAGGISTLFKQIVGLGSRRSVKVRYIDLDSFILIFHDCTEWKCNIF